MDLISTVALLSDRCGVNAIILLVCTGEPDVDDARPVLDGGHQPVATRLAASFDGFHSEEL
jgi:hypothetical protein